MNQAPSTSQLNLFTTKPNLTNCPCAKLKLHIDNKKENEGIMRSKHNPTLILVPFLNYLLCRVLLKV